MAQAGSIPPATLELSERDFELLGAAYARAEDWNPERLELRRRLGVVGTWLRERMASVGGLGLDGHTSLHHPASFNGFKVDNLRLYLSRDKRARTALAKLLGSSFRKDVDSAYRHVSLSVTMRESGLETGLSIHPDAWWDSQNAVGKALQGASEFAGVLNTARGFTLRIHDHRGHPAGKIYRDELERALKHFRIGEHYLTFTRAHVRAAVLGLSPADLAQLLADDLLALTPAYRWIAWAPDNDHLFAEGAARVQR